MYTFSTIGNVGTIANGETDKSPCAECIRYIIFIINGGPGNILAHYLAHYTTACNYCKLNKRFVSFGT